MNPDVIGDFLAMSPEKFIEKRFSFKEVLIDYIQ